MSLNTEKKVAINTCGSDRNILGKANIHCHFKNSCFSNANGQVYTTSSWPGGILIILISMLCGFHGSVYVYHACISYC